MNEFPNRNGCITLTIALILCALLWILFITWLLGAIT